MIKFEEAQKSGYHYRTLINSMADATLAFAVDFTTPGETLTRRLVEKHNKRLYFPIDLSKKISINTIKNIIDTFNFYKVKHINIAGNGIHTLLKYEITQEKVNNIVFQILEYVLKSPYLENEITKIRSGGQTGADEAGLIAASKLEIPNILCFAPKFWKFQNEHGISVYDEKQFKERFSNVLV